MTDRPRGKFYEELEIGDEFTTPARTITESDIVMYAALTGDCNPVHTMRSFAGSITSMAGGLATACLASPILTG